MIEPEIIECVNLDEAIQKYAADGYRLDMIFPADSPREALLSRKDRESADPDSGSQIRLKKSTERPVDALRSGADAGWAKGRAGMEYRDLVPGRLGGRTIASHIRLLDGGEVKDYVHYHKIEFQMIYCLNGRIRVVYEDQGPPFWLESGDCVVQPPEIRHRVLESTAGAEVLEITMPAEHETWVDHEMTLPNGRVNPDREFGGQRFVYTKNPQR
jgi:quercetin dioxygenase-like cupin family protein